MSDTIKVGGTYLCSDGTTSEVVGLADGRVQFRETGGYDGHVFSWEPEGFIRSHGDLDYVAPPSDADKIAQIRALLDRDIPEGLQDGEDGWDSMCDAVKAILDGTGT